MVEIDLRNNNLMVKSLTRYCVVILVTNNWRGIIDAKGNDVFVSGRLTMSMPLLWKRTLQIDGCPQF